MHVIVKLHGVIVGHAELRAPAVGEPVRAAFRPGLGWELIEPVFLLREEGGDNASDRFKRARAELQLELYDGGGRRLPAKNIDFDVRPAGSAPTGVELVVTGLQLLPK